MEENETILISEPTKSEPFIAKIIVTVLCITFFVLLFRQAIIQTSWFLAVFSVAPLAINILHFGSNLRDKYINEYVDEIKFSDILAWNYYEKYQEDSEDFSLIIKTENEYFIISKQHYRNYNEIINFFTKRNFKRAFYLEHIPKFASIINVLAVNLLFA